MIDKSHLKLRGRTYYVQVTVPPSLREFLQRSEIVRSLHTRDLHEAARIKYPVIAEIQQQIERARSRQALAGSASALIEAARAEREAAKERGKGSEEIERAWEAFLEQHADELRARFGTVPSTGNPRLPEPEAKIQQRAFEAAERIIAGEPVSLLSETARQYIAEARVRKLREQTVREKERHIEEFTSWLKGDVEVKSLTKRTAHEYVTEYLTKKDLALKSIKDTIANLSTFWSWLEARGAVESNIWRGIAGTLRESTRGVAPSRRGWTDEELLKLLQSIPADDPLFPLVAIALYGGLRREEIAQLKVADVEDDCFVVREGKSRSALRSVPVHSCIRPMVKRLVATSKDGYLISGLLTGGTDEKRGHYIGKRFSYFKDRAGFTDPALCFHGLRHSFVGRAREANIPEPTTQLLVGHRGESITYGAPGKSYAPGLSIANLRKAVEAIHYGPVDALVKGTAKQVTVTRKSTRRPRAVYNRRQRILKETTP